MARVHQSKQFLEATFSSLLPKFIAAAGLTVAASWANSQFNVPPASFDPEFLAEAAKIGNVMTRTDAPPVFLNPIRSGIPGNVLGPEDVE